MPPHAEPAPVASAVANPVSAVTTAQHQEDRPQAFHPALHNGFRHACLIVAGDHDCSRRATGTLCHQVTVVPSLVRLSPPPRCRVVGDPSDTPAVLRGLDLPGA